jgi:hypothetical protein
MADDVWTPARNIPTADPTHLEKRLASSEDFLCNVSLQQTARADRLH